ncbi:MAG: hypothetical protein RR470_11525, partial [Vagococcus sp.]|uniref:hypothetical protein n=1 Tax=Vagococcus sp. TaxID=1933889 RepID=UPI002FCCA1D8
KETIRTQKLIKLLKDKLTAKKVLGLVIVLGAIFGIKPLLSIISANFGEEMVEDRETILDEEYLQVKPLEIAEIEKATEKDIDKTKPLHVELKNKQLLTNRGYKIDLVGNTEIDGRGDREWSVLPDLNEYSEYKLILNVNSYEGNRFLSSSSIFIYASMVSFERGVPAGNHSFFKAFPLKTKEDIQTGYLLDCVEASPYVFTNISKYYIFPDGTGIFIELHSDNDAGEVLTKDVTYKEFQEYYHNDIENLDKTYKFSKIND